MKNRNILTITSGGIGSATLLELLHQVNFITIIVGALLGTTISFLVTKFYNWFWKKYICK